MKNFKIALLALFIFAGVSKINAQDSNNPWALSFGINMVDISDNPVSGASLPNVVRRMGDYIGASDWNAIPAISRVSVSRYINKGISVELAGALNKISKGVVGDDLDDLSYFSLDAAARYDLNEWSLIGETGWFDPYISLGAGITWLDDSSALTINPGFGFNTWFNENVGLNFQSSYKSSAFTGGELSNVPKNIHFQHSIGLAIRFGGTDTDGDGVYDSKDLCPNEAGLAEFNGCPDSDGDGIVDGDDKCPNEAGAAKFNGCPDSDGDGIVDSKDKCPNAKGSKKNQGCPDADNDGVIDSEDKCPNEAGPKANKGCAWPDTDGDSVLDKDDKCPNVAGTVTNNGCPELTVEAVKKLGDFAKTINFNSGKSTFKRGVSTTLDGIAAIMKEFSGVKFNINGYTDSTGSVAKNLAISKERAKAVKDYLASHGIAANRLKANGYGIADPIASNKTSKGRAANRRVEIIAQK